MSRFGTLMGIAAVAVAGMAASSHAQLIDDITYQGSLRSGGNAAQGVHQIRFRIFDAAVGGVQLGEEIRTKNFLSSDEGLFTFDNLTFPAGVFNGQDRYISIAVRPDIVGPFVTLGPRQPVTSAPQARYADASGTSLGNAYQNGRIINTTPGNPVQVNGAGGVIIDSILDVGEPGVTDGQFRFFTADSVFPAMQILEDFDGPRIEFNNDDGTVHTFFETDIDGGGAAFVSFDRDGGIGFQYDGNSFTNGNPRVSINGTGQSVVFNMGGTGDSVVQLPGEVIDSDEIIDEAGVANFQTFSAAVPDTGATTTLASRSITVPGPGFVLVMAQGDASVSKAAGNAVSLGWGVSDSATVLPTNQDIQFNLPSAAEPGTYDTSASAHGLFEVGSAGTFTYYFLGDTFSADAWTMFDINLTLVYIPTAYGEVSPNNAAFAGADTVPQSMQPVFAGLSPLEIQIEQDNERARVLAEIQRKERELQDLFAEHRRMMDEAAAAQGDLQD